MKRRVVNLPLFLLAIAPVYGYEVSTAVQKKKILLEEFTGINCGNCPQGHAIAQALTTAQAENAYTVAVHSGHYARPASDQPDYRTDEGEMLDSELGANNAGYPCGTVNRHRFAGTSIITSRDMWIKNGKAIHQEDAPVNLWMESEFDGATNTLTVRIEGYYTADTQENENMLNVLWTQSDIEGPQSGGGVGNEYIHKHMLRGYITEGWGDVIENPKAGQYFTRTYTYVIPEALKKVEVRPEDMEVIAFVCAAEQEVLNVTGSKPAYKNHEKPLMATLMAPVAEADTRYGYNYFEVRLKSETDRPVTEAGFEVTVNGEKQSVDWTGNIASFHTEPLRLNVTPYVMNEENDYEIRLVSLNGEAVSGNSLAGSFFSPWESTQDVIISLQTDLYADENKFWLKDADGNVIREFGPYKTDLKAVYEEAVSLEPDQIYCLEIIDEWGDGIQQPKGSFKIYNDDKTMIGSNYNILKYGTRGFFRTSLSTGLPEAGQERSSIGSWIKESQCAMVRFTPRSTGMAEIAVVSVTGKTLVVKRLNATENETVCETLDLTGMTPGIYLLRIAQNGGNETLKLTIH